MMNFEDEVLFTVERNGVEILRTESILDLVNESIESGIDLSGADSDVHIYCLESNKRMSCKNEGTLEVRFGRAKFRFLGCTVTHL